jgi:hypothetical protein
MLLPILCAAGVRAAEPGRRRIAIRGVVIAGVVAVAAFLIANPYALLDHTAFHEGLTHQAQAAKDALGKVGLTHEAGWRYYLWTFTWGLGWVPLVAAIAGGAMLAVWDRRALLVLGPAPVAYVIFMGHQERFFGRWLMPVFPIICIVGAYAMVRVVVLASRRVPALAPALGSLAVILLCGQGLVYSIHAGRVLSRPDTRNLARAWLVAHVPPTTKLVVEPVVPDAWATDIGKPYAGSSNGARWVKFGTSRSNIANDGSYIPGPGRVVNIEDYERTLFPGLVRRYEREGYCYVVSGSTQRGRAEADPKTVPRALGYYRELERSADLVYQASPYRSGAEPVKFNFDWSFDYYPLAYDSPGPVMRVYRLKGGRCRGVS